MYVVFDTNVIVSGLLWQGPPHVLFDLVESGFLTLCLTPQILDEINCVLDYPQIAKRRAIIGMLLAEAQAYLLRYGSMTTDVHRVRIVKDDPSDDCFISAAMSSGAKWIVSGDRHLLDLKFVGGIRIVTPAQFLKEIL